jgi:hypothetical protein
MGVMAINPNNDWISDTGMVSNVLRSHCGLLFSFDAIHS